jgi:mRNA-degrading endonuclease YafQ of YafQ-DinJ toxin-antitoxin module
MVPRPVNRVEITSHFERSFGKLPQEIKDKAVRADVIFRSDAFDPRLSSHKLKGKLKGLWAYSVDSRHRILFDFIDHDAALYLDIGTHEIYG